MMNEKMCAGEMLESDDLRTGFIRGLTFESKLVEYAVLDGLAIFEGDIILGTVEEMEQLSRDIQAVSDAELNELESPPEGVEFGVAITGQRYRWPYGLVPYAIDPTLPNQSRISDAIDHWQEETRIRFVQRTNRNASRYPNYINFKPHNKYCRSWIGMRGGKQDIELADGCGLGTIVHEIGHAIGLWHEQSREDRDRFVRINWENIEDGMKPNFDQHITDGDDLGRYDYASIMHYSSGAFSRNGKPTIEPL